jgi:hypothetical protein
VRRRRPARNISRNNPGTPSRPARLPDPREVRQRTEPLGVELDNQELARRRAAVDADLAAAMAPPPAAAPPARPAPAGPLLAVPVRRVLTQTALAICVEAWGYEVWLPLGVLEDPESPVVLHHQPGELLVSSTWADRTGLPPTSTTRSIERTPR